MKEVKNCMRVICFCVVIPVLLYSVQSSAGNGIEYIKIALPEYNWSLNNMTNGETYGYGGDYTSLIGGIPFTIANGIDDTYNIWHSMGSESHVLSIQVNEYGVDKVHTFINTFYGSDGANIGTIAFLGSEGATYSIDFVEGINVRDHYQGNFVNEILSPMTSLAYSPGSHVILDRQEIILPDSFKTQTLVSIAITDTNLGYQYNGKIFLTALTLERPVPEPATVGILSFGALSLLRRKK